MPVGLVVVTRLHVALTLIHVVRVGARIRSTFIPVVRFTRRLLFAFVMVVWLRSLFVAFLTLLRCVVVLLRLVLPVVVTDLRLRCRVCSLRLIYVRLFVVRLFRCSVDSFCAAFAWLRARLFDLIRSYVVVTLRFTFNVPVCLRCVAFGWILSRCVVRLRFPLPRLPLHVLRCAFTLDLRYILDLRFARSPLR